MNLDTINQKKQLAQIDLVSHIAKKQENSLRNKTEMRSNKVLYKREIDQLQKLDH
jgi:hypothetical protein